MKRLRSKYDHILTLGLEKKSATEFEKLLICYRVEEEEPDPAAKRGITYQVR